MQGEQAQADADAAHQQRNDAGDHRGVQETTAVFPVFALEQPAQGACGTDRMVDGIHA
ncbi:hypothetical protein D3C78_1925890 [compost metagenome]